MATETNNANTHVSNLIGKFRVETTAPDNPKEGDMYYNSSSNYLMYYTGSEWVGAVFLQ